MQKVKESSGYNRSLSVSFNGRQKRANSHHSGKHCAEILDHINVMMNKIEGLQYAIETRQHQTKDQLKNIVCQYKTINKENIYIENTQFNKRGQEIEIARMEQQISQLQRLLERKPRCNQ